MIIYAGIDEAGRGPLAGPVTAACVVLPEGYQNDSIKDSKKLSAVRREKLFDLIINDSIFFSIVSVGPRRIEQLNIRNATRQAMELCAFRVESQLRKKFPDATVKFLVDGDMPLSSPWLSEAIVKGDSKVKSISAASILAKVSRDRIMQVLDKKFPQYGFSKHKGYPTSAHREAVKLVGPSRVHRRSFGGVSEYC
jgi:ribonuclease HII